MNRIDKYIKRKIGEAKKKEAKEKYDKIEALQKKFDSFNVHRRKISKLINKYIKGTWKF